MGEAIWLALSTLRALHPKPCEHQGVVFTRRCAVAPARAWDRMQFEGALSICLPDDVLAFWDACGGARLFEDTNYGQWGIVLWGPDESALTTASRIARDPSDFRSGDLLIGEFRGDADLIIVRADPASRDYGSVLICLPIDRRPDWPTAATSLSQFLERLIANEGAKYWDLAPG